MKIFTFLFFVFVSYAGIGQAGSGQVAGARLLEVTIQQDVRIDTLLRAHSAMVSRERGISGFRVQLSADSGAQSKLRTQRRKSEFDARFPEVGSYIIFDSPEFKLRVGNFRTRLDASRFLEKIARDYPAAFIVVDRINFPGFD
ncbi:MAG TPA: SPOR domain-containing protein [Bacteroidales bacterium]|nr:SPOR domain-containing protein [Bacteroidales bacterium]